MQKRTRVAIARVISLSLLFGTVSVPRSAAQRTLWPTQGWRHSTPEAQGMDSRVLADAFTYVRDHQIPIHSLTIVRNGYVVLDAYFWPFQDGQLHDLASVTKSVTSTLVGIAIGKHELELRQPLTSVFNQRRVARQPLRVLFGRNASPFGCNHKRNRPECLRFRSTRTV